MQLATLLLNLMIKNTVVPGVACTCYIGLKSIRPLICPSFLLKSMHGAFTVNTKFRRYAVILYLMVCSNKNSCCSLYLSMPHNICCISQPGFRFHTLIVQAVNYIIVPQFCFVCIGIYSKLISASALCNAITF